MGCERIFKTRFVKKKKLIKKQIFAKKFRPNALKNVFFVEKTLIAYNTFHYTLFFFQEVNFDLMKITGKEGGRMEDTALVQGIILDKEFSHPPKEITDAKIALLTCPFEPPKPKTKHTITISEASHYGELYAREQAYFTEMLDLCVNSGATCVMCQWGFDDEANHLLLPRSKLFFCCLCKIVNYIFSPTYLLLFFFFWKNWPKK